MNDRIRQQPVGRNRKSTNLKPYDKIAAAAQAAAEEEKPKRSSRSSSSSKAPAKPADKKPAAKKPAATKPAEKPAETKVVTPGDADVQTKSSDAEASEE